MSDIQLFGLIRGVVLPALVSGAIYLIARFTPGVFRQTLRSAGVSAGVFLAFILLLGPPSWPWAGSPLGILAACVFASMWPLVENLAGRRIWFTRYIGLALVSVVVLKPFIFLNWTTLQAAQVVIAIASVGAIVWLVLDRASENMHTAGTLASYVVMATGLAITMAMEGSASLGQMGGALCAALGAPLVLALFGFVRPGRSELNGAFLIIFLSLALAHGFYADTNWYWNLWLVSPLIYLMARSFTAAMPSSPIKDALLSAVISAIPVGYALFTTYRRLV